MGWKGACAICNYAKFLQVVLVSGLDMESGFSRELFLEWCTDTKNMVIVTGSYKGNEIIQTKYI
jgi:purine-nucleoside phosphorylase